MLVINKLKTYRALAIVGWRIESRNTDISSLRECGRINTEQAYTQTEPPENNVPHILLVLSATAKPDLDPGKGTFYRKYI